MDFNQLAEILAETESSTVCLVRVEPEIPDFTAQQEVKLQIWTKDKQFSILFTNDNLKLAISMLQLSLFAKGKKIITWNWKNFCSYFQGKTGISLTVAADIVDLKILESYADLNGTAPTTLGEALTRLKRLVEGGHWARGQAIYKRIHLPLMTAVIPGLETSGILDTERRQKVHAYYEIDGQENGRLKCHGAYSQSFVPHNLGEEKKKTLKPNELDGLFMYFDYKANEPTFLAWLSKDEGLLDICRQGDIYSILFERLLEQKCLGKVERNRCKKIFLPVIYGMSPPLVAKNMEISESSAVFVVNRIYNLFPTALSYVEGFQKQAQEAGYAIDFFGKRRCFEEKNAYAARGFSVQSPAAVFCLDRLVQLYFSLKEITDLAYHVHDGYAVYATKHNWKKVYQISRDILTAENDLCPGLRLRATCHAGRNLNDLKLLASKKE